MLSLIYSFKLYTCQNPRIPRAYTAQNTKKSTLLNCLAQCLSALKSRCGTDTAGRGALEAPPEDGVRAKLYDRQFQSRELHSEAETKKKQPHWLVTRIIGRAKNLGLLGQSLLTKLANIYAVAIRLVICIMYVI